MINVDNITIFPNPVDAGASCAIEVQLHEEHENAKRYPYKYPYRYGEDREVTENGD